MTRSDWLPIAILGGFVVLADIVIVVVELTSSGPSSSSWGASSSEPASTRPGEPVLTPRELRASRDAGVAPLRPTRPAATPTEAAPSDPGAEPTPTSTPRRPRRTPTSEPEIPEMTSGSGPPKL